MFLTIFAFGVDFDEYLLRTHDLNDLAYVRPWLLQQAKLFSQ
jgi:hypothetical protein